MIGIQHSFVKKVLSREDRQKTHIFSWTDVRSPTALGHKLFREWSAIERLLRGFSRFASFVATRLTGLSPCCKGSFALLRRRYNTSAPKHYCRWQSFWLAYTRLLTTLFRKKSGFSHILMREAGFLTARRQSISESALIQFCAQFVHFPVKSILFIPAEPGSRRPRFEKIIDRIDKGCHSVFLLCLYINPFRHEMFCCH